LNPLPRVAEGPDCDDTSPTRSYHAESDCASTILR
jgi:hypothetical protein